MSPPKPDPAGDIAAPYDRHARAWDADRSGAVWAERGWHGRFAAALPPGAEVLDLGCGGGAPVAVHLAACGLGVTGVDTSPRLIARCRTRLPGHRWIVGDMRAPPVSGRFGGIVAWDSFFHLAAADQRAMFAVFAAHAAPGAALLFNTGPAAGESIGTYRGDALYHASLDPAEYAALLDEHGFDIADHIVADPAAGDRTVWLARARA